MQRLRAASISFLEDWIPLAPMAPKKNAVPAARVPEHQGPQNLEEMYRWPSTILHRLLQRGDASDSLRRARLQAIFSRGVYVCSDYSGMAGEYELLHQMLAPLNSALQTPSPITVKHKCVCDFGAVQQRVLRYISVMLENSGTCVMNDINDRLTDQARGLLDSLMPPDGAPPHEAMAAYESMLTWLIENRSTAFAEDGKSDCVIHGRRCPLRPPRSSMEPSTENEALVMSFAGTTCKGWSTVGKRKCFSDPSERPHGVWLCDRMRAAESMQEDLFFSECTARYPAEAGFAELQGVKTERCDKLCVQSFVGGLCVLAKTCAGETGTALVLDA